MIHGRPDMPDTDKTCGAPRMVAGYCPECNGPRAVRNWYESWPLVHCSCGWRGATTELLHRVRLDHTAFAAAETGPADLQELVGTLRDQIAIFRRATEEATPTECWVVLFWDMGWRFEGVYLDPVQAFRAAQGGGSEVVQIPFGEVFDPKKHRA